MTDYNKRESARLVASLRVEPTMHNMNDVVTELIRIMKEDEEFQSIYSRKPIIMLALTTLYSTKSHKDSMAIYEPYIERQLRSELPKRNSCTVV